MLFLSVMVCRRIKVYCSFMQTSDYVILFFFFAALHILSFLIETLWPAPLVCMRHCSGGEFSRCVLIKTYIRTSCTTLLMRCNSWIKPLECINVAIILERLSKLLLAGFAQEDKPARHQHHRQGGTSRWSHQRQGPWLPSSSIPEQFPREVPVPVYQASTSDAPSLLWRPFSWEETVGTCGLPWTDAKTIPLSSSHHTTLRGVGGRVKRTTLPSTALASLTA